MALTESCLGQRRYEVIFAILSSRLVLAAALVTFGGSVIALPISYRSPSTAGRFLARFTLERRSTSCFGGSPESAFACRTANGYLFSGNIRELPELPQVWLNLNRSNSTSGFWAITQSTSTASVQVHAVDGYQFSPDEPARIRAAFLDQYASAHPDAVAIVARIRYADGQIAAPIPLGYLHNCISLLSFLVLGSCTARQRPWKWFKRKLPGQCGFCHYDLSATAPTLPCPECGSSQAQIAPA